MLLHEHDDRLTANGRAGKLYVDISFLISFASLSFSAFQLCLLLKIVFEQKNLSRILPSRNSASLVPCSQVWSIAPRAETSAAAQNNNPSLKMRVRLSLHALLALTFAITLASASPLSSLSLNRSQNTGCYCGTLTGTSCGSRTSTGLSLSGDCSANVLYSCKEQFGTAQVDLTCLVCDSQGQDGFDSCLLGLGLV